MSTPPAPRAPWRLRPLHVEGVPALLDVPPDGLVLGRDPTCDAVLAADVYRTVSARHARLVAGDGGLELVDLGSTNGTLVDGARVERRVLAHGEVFQLGAGGPRFAVLAPRVGAGPPAGRSGLARTAFAPRDAAASERDDIASADVEPAAQPACGVPARSTRRSPRAWLAVAAVLAVVGATAAIVRRAEALRAERLERSVDERLAASRGALEAQRARWQEQRAAFERARVAWEATRGELAAARDALETRLASLEASGATAADVEALERELAAARTQLGRFDPDALERARVEELQRVERAVVLVETREVLVEPESRRVLYVAGTGVAADFNLEGRGAPFANETTGSGLCISPDGHVLTNAHVVEGSRSGAPMLTAHGRLERETRVAVVFSGTDRRHPAELVALVHDERHDLALLKIAPFEGLPYVNGVELDTAVPPRGTEVYAIGFPLGKRVLQAGDTVIASAFRGIVSRTVEPFVQFDAAVHPGASGGPVIDAHGRVVGIVTAMQSADPSASSSQIGYMLPIERASAVLPPRDASTRE